MITQIHRITPDCQPEFPCWLWCPTSPGYNNIPVPAYWYRIESVERAQYDRTFDSQPTHWHPDQPSVPTATPPTEQATEGGVATERDVRCHVAAPAQGKTPDTLYAAALDTLKDMSAQVAQLTGAQDLMDAEIAMLTADLFRATRERDQARQDLEERCAGNDRERSIHLQAYQEACKERDEARAEAKSANDDFLAAAIKHQSELAELRLDRETLTGEAYFIDRDLFMRYINNEVQPARLKEGLAVLSERSCEVSYDIIKSGRYRAARNQQENRE